MKINSLTKYPFIILKKKKRGSKLKKISNHKSWTQEEDNLLINIVNNIGSRWKFISKYFPKRNIFEIYNRYFKINPSLKKGRFSKAEDDQIINYIKVFGVDWARLAKIMKNRTSKQIRSRYFNKLHLNNIDNNSSTEEDNSMLKSELENSYFLI